MMGLSRNALWTAHFLHYCVMFLVTVTLVTIVLMAPWIPARPVIKYTDPTIVWLVLFLFGTSLITFGFFISTWFDTGSVLESLTPTLSDFNLKRLNLMWKLISKPKSKFCCRNDLYFDIFRVPSLRIRILKFGRDFRSHPYLNLFTLSLSDEFWISPNFGLGRLG